MTLKKVKKERIENWLKEVRTKKERSWRESEEERKRVDTR